MSYEKRHELYDNPLEWGKFGIWEPPTFDVEGFQAKIDAIVGTSLGKPIVRLVWAWDKRCREFYFTKWDSAGKGIEGEFEYKYRVARIPIGNGDTVDICPPRWILEQRFEPGQYGPSWEQSRFAEKDNGKRHVADCADPLNCVNPNCEPIRQRLEMKPPPPADGWYQLLWSIAEHEPDRACCARLYAERRRNCWGYYRLPAEKDLERLRRAVSLRDADSHRVDPHAPMSQTDLDEAYRAAFAEDQIDQEARRKELDDAYHNYAVALGVEPTKYKAGKRLKGGVWHDINPASFRRTSAGLLIPK